MGLTFTSGAGDVVKAFTSAIYNVLPATLFYSLSATFFSLSATSSNMAVTTITGTPNLKMEDVEVVSSYNCIAADSRTIIVPGKLVNDIVL